MQLKNKKILYFITTKSGFCRNNYISVATEAMKQGAKIFVLCREDNEENIYRKAGFRVFVYNHYSFFNFYKIYKSVRPDIVHHVGLSAILRGSFASLFTKPKKIFNTFLGRFGIPYTKTQRFITRLFLKRENSYLITENKEDRQDALDKKLVPEERLFMVPGFGINVKEVKQQDEPKGAFTFALADIIRWDRGVGEYIKAIEIIKSEKEMDADFILSGFAETVKASNIPNRKLLDWTNQEIANWWGYIRDPLKIWSRSTVAVFPAYANGLCVTIAQAAAAGKPLILADVRGNNLFFKHEENALLVPEKNPQALANAMKRLYSDDKLRKKLGNAARETALENFKEGKFLNMQIELYKEGKIS